MRRALLLFLILTTASCTFVMKRSGCGLRCEANSSCEVIASGVFATGYGCRCRYGKTAFGNLYPSKGDPCPVMPALARFPLCPTVPGEAPRPAGDGTFTCRAVPKAHGPGLHWPKPYCKTGASYCDCYVGRGVEEGTDLFEWRGCAR